MTNKKQKFLTKDEAKEFEWMSLGKIKELKNIYLESGICLRYGWGEFLIELNKLNKKYEKEKTK